MTRTIALVLFLTIAATTPAQRLTPTFEWQDRTTVIAYGPAPFGKHSLAELAVGDTWRLGMNEASTWRLNMPAVVGDVVIAPGHYRIRMQRSAEERFSVVVEGSALATGTTSDARIDGTFAQVAKPAKKLAVEWLKDGVPQNDNQGLRLRVQFGSMEWTGALHVLGGKTVTAGPWKITTFTVPAALFAARDRIPLPVASLHRGKDEAWNLVFGKTEARLVPWMSAPTEQFGFGEVVPPEKAKITTGRIEGSASQVETPNLVAETKSATVAKGELAMEIRCGSEEVRVLIPLPKATAK